MKALKYLVGVVFLLLIGFLLLGLFSPSIQYSNGIEVSKGADEAFAVMMDETKMDKWLPGYKGSKLIKGQPNEPETQYEITMEHDGEIMNMLETVKAYEPGKRYAFHLSNDVLESDMDILFTPKGEKKAVLNSSTQLRGNNLIYRALFVLMKKSMSRQDADNMARLKSVIESNTTDYFAQPAADPLVGDDVPETQ